MSSPPPAPDLAPPYERRRELRHLWALGRPILVAQLGMMLLGFVDTLMVGQRGAEALAGIALGHTWSFAALFLGIGTAIGLDPAIAQAHGAGDRDAVGRAVTRGLVLITVMTPVLMALQMYGDVPLSWLGQDATVVPLAAAYASITAWSTWALLVFSVIRQSLQAREAANPLIWIMGVANVVNVVGNIVLMEGVGSWEGIGVLGVAWSTVAARAFMCVATVAVAHQERAAIALAWREAFDLRALGRLAGLALPIGVQASLEVWAFTGSTLIAGTFGPTALAAHVVALNLSSLSFMVPLSLGAATAARVGNLLGAGRSWWPSGRLALGVGVVTMSGFAALYTLLPGPLANLYLPYDDPALPIAATLLPLAGLFQVFDGLQVVAFGVLRGAGDTRVPALANVLGYYVIGLPLGWWLGRYAGLGVQGIWVAFAVALGLIAAMLLTRLRAVVAGGGTRVEA